ncbi:MAG: hypothetical protein JWR10_512 [Rubritepida sp.]|nr:hypothetical protein [Rubritepida sp.]
MDLAPIRTGIRPVAVHADTWSVAVFARNEAARIGPCLRALSRATGAERLHVTVLLNGTQDGSDATAAAAMREAGLAGCLYDIPFGDKSHAINLYLHRLRPTAAMHVLMDGYAEIWPEALALLARRLATTPEAQAAAAVPSTGRSSAALRRHMLAAPGLHGSLFALRDSFVERLTAAGYRLPRGLYRGDGLLGSMVLHDLDALGGGWIGSRIAVEGEASWSIQPGRVWRWRDLSRHGRRMLQQGRGRLERTALRAVIYRDGFGGLPEDANRMVLDWIAEDPQAHTPRPWRDPFALAALARIRQAGPGPSAEELEPRLLLRMPGT